MARELGMPIPPRLLQRKQAITNINDHGKLHGHILPVFCVTFDQTGRYVLTVSLLHGFLNLLIKLFLGRRR